MVNGRGLFFDDIRGDWFVSLDKIYAALKGDFWWLPLPSDGKSRKASICSLVHGVFNKSNKTSKAWPSYFISLLTSELSTGAERVDLLAVGLRTANLTTTPSTIKSSRPLPLSELGSVAFASGTSESPK